jgi:hypothetical protein
MSLTDAQRHALTQALGQLMSDISESNWAAAWLVNTEEALPEACRAPMNDVSLGHANDFFSSLTDIEIPYLVYLADLLGHWAVPDDTFVNYLPYFPSCETTSTSTVSYCQ